MIARNAAGTLPRLLAHMEAHGIPVVMIDHGSTDETRAIGAARLGGIVRELIDEPYRGVFDLTGQLELKRAIIKRLEVDWIVNLDADEFLMPPNPAERLLDFLRRHAASPGEAVTCDEYTFLPASEDETNGSDSFVETMTGYVHLRPRDAKQRIFRRRAPLDRWMRTGGHYVSPNALPERLLLHHYIGLSLDHLRAQYLGRVFSARDVAKGWHYDRRSFGTDFIAAPAPGELLDCRRDGLRGDRPVSQLPVFRHPSAAPLRPALLPGGTDLVVACDRPAAIARVVAWITGALPGVRVAQRHRPARGLPRDVALLQIITDGRGRLGTGRPGRAREQAAAWCGFVTATRQEGLRVAGYAELRIEDLDAGEADLEGALDELLGAEEPDGVTGFHPHAPWRAAPPCLPADDVRIFEALAGPLLRDLGYAPPEAW